MRLALACPLFYVETLADLEKAVRDGRTPEQEIRIIADKFPEKSGSPCIHHVTLAVQKLIRGHVPLNGRIPMPSGRVVERNGKQGVIFDRPSVSNFSRRVNHPQAARPRDTCPMSRPSCCLTMALYTHLTGVFSSRAPLKVR